MPPPPGNSDPDLWIVDLPPSKETSVGSLSGLRISSDGTTEHVRENEDRYYTCKLDGVQLYLLLDGHNGSRACDFARKRIPSLLLQRNMGEGGERAAEALQYTFENTEKQFFMMLDPSITQKMSLQIEIQEKGGTTSMLAYSMFPEKVEELQRLDELISGGTTAVLALILNDRQLWVANVGDSRAVLCYLDRDGKLHAEQISEDHNTMNDKEIARLVECGLDGVRLRSSGRLGAHQNTRSIGDYSVKGGYKDHDILSGATREPGSAEPFISHPPLYITAIRGFLLLMSDGLYDAHAAITNSPQTVNHDIAILVQRHLDHAPTIDEVAAKVAAEVSTNYQSVVRRSRQSARMDDITLIIRNLGYPVGQLSGNFSVPTHSVQSPYDLGQSPQQQQAHTPRYENAQFLQQQQLTVSASSAATPSSARGSAHYSSAGSNHHPSVHVGHQNASEIPNSTYSGHSQHASHYPHAGGHNTAQQQQQQHMQGDGGGVNSSGRVSDTTRTNHPAPATNYQEHVDENAHHTPTQDGGVHRLSETAGQTQSISYENWDMGRGGHPRPAGHEDSTDLTGNMSALNMGHSSGQASRGGSSSSGGQHRHGTQSSTNTETQFQSAQHVSRVSSQQRSPNVTVNWSSATDNSGSGSAVSGKKQSAVDDELWMYNHDVPGSVAGSSVGDSTDHSERGEEGGERNDDGESSSGGRDGDSTVMVELELEGDRGRAHSQVEEEEEEEENGMIKPIIKFDKFPPDLSWDQI